MLKAVDTEASWRAVPGYEGFYEVSDLGEVRSLDRATKCRIRGDKDSVMTFSGRTLSPDTSATGYRSVRLSLPSQKPRKLYVHRLVMLTFAGPPDDQQTQVNHRNGVKADNRLVNLEFSTPRQNMLHMTRVLGNGVGSASGHAKLSEQQVAAILKDQRLLREIAAEYGVSVQNISLIQSGKAWVHVAGKRLRRMEKRLENA